MRILHLHSGNLYGGVESILATIARHQPVAAAHHQFALCFPGRIERELVGVLAGVHRLGPVRVSRPWSVARARHRLTILLQRLAPDVVICHAAWAHAIFARTAQEEGYPVLTWLHGPARGRHWVERWAAAVRPDRVICTSQFVAATVDRLFPGAPTSVVHPPVAPPDRLVSRAERADIRKTLGAAEPELVIVQVSRLEPGKGHAVLIKALAQLAGGWRCWIVGGAQRASERRYARRIRELVRRNGLEHRVRFLGERFDVARLLQAADVYCHPNTGPEAFGITLVEALYAGLPVVATRVGGPSEIIDGGSGVLVPPDDWSALAETLRAMLVGPRVSAASRHAAKARARALCDPMARLGQLAGICRGAVARWHQAAQPVAARDRDR